MILLFKRFRVLAKPATFYEMNPMADIFQNVCENCASNFLTEYNLGDAILNRNGKSVLKLACL